MRRKLTLTIFVLLLFFTVLASFWIQPAAPVNSQIFPTFPVITLFPTATRTPTPVQIGNFVWDDLDKDGIQDAGEPGLGGVIVQLWNASKTQLLYQTTSEPTGIYQVIAPRPGDYYLRAVLPSAADQFSPKHQGADAQKDSDINPSGFSDLITIAPSVISTTIYDVGIIVYRVPTPTRTPTPVLIGNFVWDDLDKDGIQDAGEPGIGGVVVQLWNASRTELIFQTTSGPNGIYQVIAPRPGDYHLRALLPGAGDKFSPKHQGANALNDSDINPSGALLGFSDLITIASSVISTTIYDVGIIVDHTAIPTSTPPPPGGNKMYLPLIRK